MAVRKFCWCIPTRIGVLILSPLVSMMAIMSLIAEAYSLHNYMETPGFVWTKLSMGVYCAFSAALAISALVGFIGACTQSRKAVTMYSKVLWLGFWVNLGSTVWLLVSRWVNKDQAIRKCAAQLAKAERPWASLSHSIVVPTIEDRRMYKATYNVSYSILFFLSLVLLFLLLSVCIVTARYMQELKEAQFSLPLVQLHHYDATAEPLPPSAHEHPPAPSPAYEPPRAYSGSPRSSSEGKCKLKEVKL